MATWPAIFPEKRSRVAATLTDTGELTFASFPIEKMETDENGDLVIFGKISDAGLD